MGKIVFAILFLGVSVSFAKPSCDTLKEKWSTKYKSDFNIDVDDSFSCEAEGTLALAFYDLENFKYDSSAVFEKPDFYNMVKKKLAGMQLANCQYLAVTNTETHVMTICSEFINDSREDRASTLVHESRHLDEDDPGHVTCASGKYKGDEGACDAEFFDGGEGGSGYNRDIYFYNWVLHYGTQNEFSRSVIQSEINHMVPDRFNEIRIDEIKKWRS